MAIIDTPLRDKQGANNETDMKIKTSLNIKDDSKQRNLNKQAQTRNNFSSRL